MTFPYCPRCGTDVLGRGIRVYHRTRDAYLGVHGYGLLTVVYRLHPTCWREAFEAHT